MKKSYDEIRKIFEDKECELYTTKEQYDEMKTPNKSIFHFKTSCQHDNTVTLTNFIQKGSGVICKNCNKINVSLKLSNYQKDNSISTSVGLEQEYRGYKHIYSIIEDEFDIQKTNEGCLSDFVIKPKYIEDDKWMMIQIKTCQNICHNLYTFSSHGTNYENCLVLCLCLNDSKMWLIDYIRLIDKNKLNIGLTEKSEFFKFQYDNDELKEQFHKEYATMKRFKKEICLIPRSPNQQVEHRYRLIREKKLPYLNFVYPEVEGQRTDFYINSYKIQEKVAFPKTGRENTYIVSLHKNNGKLNKKAVHKCYEKDDNDFYWAWIKDTNSFYIFPESILIQKEYIQVNNNLEDKKQAISVNVFNTNWTKKYKYQLDDIDLINKLKKLFNIII